MAANRIKGITIELNGDATPLQRALKGVDQSLKTTQANLKDIDKLLKLKPGNVELLTQKQKNLESAIASTKSRLQQLKDAQSDVAKGTPEWDALQREIINTEAKLKSLEKEYRNFGSVGAQQVAVVGEKMEKFGSKVASVGKSLTKWVTTPLLGAGVASVKTALSFDDAIAKLSTIADTSETSGVSLDDLRKQILKLSDDTGIAAEEVATNIYDAISAGQDTADAVAFVTSSTKLATAGFADAGSALDLLTTILNAYGLEADQVSHVSDVLINTQNKGKTTVAQLASSMGKVIPTANAAGVSLEQLAAGYSIMTANGIATAETTTYLNSLLNELSKSGTKSSEALKEATGKSFQTLTAEGSSLSDVLQILSDSAAKNSLSLQDMFGSAEAGKAALVLLGDDAETFNAALADMQGIVGATDLAFGRLDTKTRKGRIALNQIKNAAGDLGATILDLAAPAIEKTSKFISDLTKKLSAMDPKTKQTIVKIAGIAAAIGPVLTVGGKLIGGVGKALKLAPTIVKAVKLVTGVFSPWTLVIAAVVAGGVLLYKNWDKISDWFKSTIVPRFQQAGEDLRRDWEEIKRIGESVKAAVTKAWDGLKSGVVNSVNNLKTAVTGAWNALKTSVVNTATGIKDGAVNAWTALKNGISNAGSALQSAVTGAWNALKTSVVSSATSIKDGVVNAWTALKTGVSTAGSALQSAVTGSWNALKTSVVNTATSIKDGAVNAWTALKNGISNAGSALQSAVTGSWNALKTSVVNTATGIKDGAVNAWTALKNGVSNAVETLKSSVSDKWNSIKSATASFVDNIKSKFNFHWSLPQLQLPSWDSIRSRLNTIISNIKNLFHFDWSLPHIKLPHFSVTAGKAPYGLGGQGYLPSINVSWYRRAYDKPVMFRSPTVLATPSGYKGFGDGNGAEIVMGLNKLREVVGAGRSDNITINVYGAPGQDVNALADAIQYRLVALQRQKEVAGCA